MKKITEAVFVFSRADVFSLLIRRARLLFQMTASQTHICFYIGKKTLQHSKKLMVYNIRFVLLFCQRLNPLSHIFHAATQRRIRKKAPPHINCQITYIFLPGVEYIGRVIPSTMGRKRAPNCVLSLSQTRAA
jgi:hypothetical protein